MFCAWRFALPAAAALVAAGAGAGAAAAQEGWCLPRSDYTASIHIVVYFLSNSFSCLSPLHTTLLTQTLLAHLCHSLDTTSTLQTQTIVNAAPTAGTLPDRSAYRMTQFLKARTKTFDHPMV